VSGGSGAGAVDAVSVRGWGVASHAGPGKQNQDRFGLDGTLFSVADGMGGLAFGEGAASEAVVALHRAAPQGPDGLSSAVFAANSAVRALAHRRDARVGTTLVALLVIGDGVSLVAVGDSRCYQLEADDRLVQLTVDDTRATLEGVDRDSPHYPELSRFVTRSLGERSVLDVVAVGLPVDGPIARFVLTTDGVHDAVTHEALQTAAAIADPNEAALAVVAAATAANTHDDATAVVVDVVRSGVW
jgi:protein phosphatase